MLMEIANLQTRIDQNNLQIQCLEKGAIGLGFKIEEKMREVQELAKQKQVTKCFISADSVLQ